ncbi:hypothetical protein RCL1_001109 [Eukaryota sp. TZLM3-RCL]
MNNAPDDECIKVAVRVRPLSQKELTQAFVPIVDADENERSITIMNNGQPQNFYFDGVFSSNATQENVYAFVHSSIESCLGGFNATIIAYGQTGTGKTHTMEGQLEPVNQRGIIPNAFDHIFGHISATPNLRFLVRASMLEIYNEEIHDLLVDDGGKKNQNNKLEIREHPDTGPFVDGLKEETVTTAEDLLNLLRRGTNRRTTAETNMNKSSSRSHSIFTIRIESSEEYDDGCQRIKVAKLNLVDLAGSERQSKTGATGVRLLEASKINKSLLTLGYVIKSLVEGTARHVPYRDSKLTRLLQDSLGGNAKTVMIATVGPAQWNYDESLSTLRYANSAKQIKNKPRVNEDPKDSKIRDLQAELERLRRQLEQQQIIDQQVVISTQMEPQIIKETIVVHVPRSPSLEPEDEETIREREMEEELRRQKEAEYEKQLKEKEEYLKQQEFQRMEMENKIKALEEKLVVGGAIEDIAKQQEIEMRRLQAENEERRRQEILLARELESKSEEQRLFEEKYASLNDEIEDKTRKLKQLFKQVQKLRTEISSNNSSFQDERLDFLEQIRILNRTLQLKNFIIDSFVPIEVSKYIESRAIYLEDDEEWTLPDQELAGNYARLARPLSFSDLSLNVSSNNLTETIPIQAVEKSVRRHADVSSSNNSGLVIDNPVLLSSFFGVDSTSAAGIVPPSGRKEGSRSKNRPPTSVGIPPSSARQRPTESARSSAVPKARNLVEQKLRYA